MKRLRPSPQAANFENSWYSSDLSATFALLAIKLALRFDGTERDQQKWIPVLRPIAL
jgi:hypothetical protein